MATRKPKRKRTEAEIPEVTGAENPTNAPGNRKPSGYPFTDQEPGNLGPYECWGDSVKSWLEYDRVLAICVTSGGWTLAEIHLKKQKLIIHDAKGYKLQHQPEEKEKIKRSFIPMLRVLPQILKSIGYYKQHRIKNPQYDQFRFAFGPFTGRMAFREVDAADGPLYCMKHIEFLVSAISIERGLENPQVILDYRRHVAKTIYAHNTDAKMVSYSQNVDNNDKKGKSLVAFNLDAKE